VDGLVIGTPQRVEIYSVNGRRVRKAMLSPGDRSFVWDGRSDAGQQQSPGVYFLRLLEENGRVLASKKVMMLK